MFLTPAGHHGSMRHPAFAAWRGAWLTEARKAPMASMTAGRLVAQSVA